jgi:glycosyltransferase involved in cell wall biosynthesis
VRIIFIAKEYPPYGENFATALFYPRLAQALVARGHVVYVVSQTPGKGQAIAEESGVKIFRVGPSPIRGNPFRRFLYSFNAFRKIVNLASNEPIDVIDAPITFGEAFFVSLQDKIPVVLQTFAFSGMFLETRSHGGVAERASLRVSALLEDISLRRAERIIANSPHTYRYLLERKRIRPDRISLIWESRIDLKEFNFVPSDIRSRRGIGAGVPLILNVGWLQPRKGLHVLVEALQRIGIRFPEALVVLVGRDTPTAPGGGSFRAYLSAHARRFGVVEKMMFIDEYLPRQELVRLYSASDVFVMPSLSETFGWPVIEAMACCRPVVATSTGIAPDLGVSLPTFALIRRDDAVGLADAIVQILDMPRDVRETQARLHRHFVEERFSFERMVDQILEVYDEAAKSRRRKARNLMTRVRGGNG